MDRKPLFGSFKDVNHSILMTSEIIQIDTMLTKLINRELVALGFLTFHLGIVFSTLLWWVYMPPSTVEVYYTTVGYYSVSTIIFGWLYGLHRSRRVGFVADLQAAVANDK